MSVPLKISVVMPSLNQGAYLDEAISSVITQGDNVELIVIDGGSTDNSVEIIEKHATAIRYWVSEKDHGQSDAINKGLAIATGDVITWLNSDDLYTPGALQKVREFFADNPETDLLHGRALLTGKGRLKEIGPTSTLQKWEYLPYMRFPQPSSFFRQSLMRRLAPLCGGLHYAMDHELVARAILLGAGIAGTKELFSLYRLHRASKSMDELPFLKEWNAVFANVLYSLPNAGEFSESLASLNLGDNSPQNKFEVGVTFSTEEIKLAYLEHLHLQFHGYYRRLEKKTVTAILGEIMRFDHSFAVRQKYDKYLLRMRMLPSFIFRLFRTLKG